MKIYLKGKGNVYLQIVEQYKKYISLNVIKENEKLPSCRTLASELGINPNTVERAYSILEKENYIVTIPKKGVYVKKLNNISPDNHIISQVKEFKLSGISKDELIKIIENIYKEENTHD